MMENLMENDVASDGKKNHKKKVIVYDSSAHES